MKAATLMGVVAVCAALAACAAEPVKPASADQKDLFGQKMAKCECMEGEGRAGAQAAQDGKMMECPKEGMSDEHKRRMHEHMHPMQGEMTGKDAPDPGVSPGQ